MRPLLVHASSPATVPSRRRVVHLEFAAAELPSPLEWAERVPVVTPDHGTLALPRPGRSSVATQRLGSPPEVSR